MEESESTEADNPDDTRKTKAQQANMKLASHSKAANCITLWPICLFYLQHLTADFQWNVTRSKHTLLTAGDAPTDVQFFIGWCWYPQYGVKNVIYRYTQFTINYEHKVSRKSTDLIGQVLYISQALE